MRQDEADENDARLDDDIVLRAESGVLRNATVFEEAPIPEITSTEVCRSNEPARYPTSPASKRVGSLPRRSCHQPAEQGGQGILGQHWHSQGLSNRHQSPRGHSSRRIFPRRAPPWFVPIFFSVCSNLQIWKLQS